MKTRKLGSIIAVLLTVAMMLTYLSAPASAACALPLPAYPAGASYAKNDCWNFANMVYNAYWGYKFTSSQYTSDNIIKDVAITAAARQATAANLKKYITQAPVGSVLRISRTLDYVTAASDGDAGHSLIIVNKDSNGFTHYDVGGGKVVLQYHTYANYASSVEISGLLVGNAYIKYIKAGSGGSVSTKPTNAKLTASATSINLGQSITLNMSSTNGTRYYLGVWVGDKRVVHDTDTPTTYTFTPTEPGEYRAYFTVYNAANDLADSNEVYWTVKGPPTDATLTASATSLVLGQSITLDMSASDGKQWYLGVWTGNKRVVNDKYAPTTYTFTPTEVGEYRAYFTVYNDVGFADSNTVYFTVTEPVLESISIESLPEKTVYKPGEEVDITGLMIKKTFSDGSTQTEPVTDRSTYSPHLLNQIGTETITVTIEGKRISFEVVVTNPDPAILHAEDIIAPANSTVTVPIYLKNIADLEYIGDGSIGGATIYFTCNRSKVYFSGFTAAGIFKNYTYRTGENAAIGKRYIKLYCENDPVIIQSYMSGDTLIGYCEFTTTENFTTSQIGFEIQSAYDNSSAYSDTYNDYILTESFTIHSVAPENIAILHAENTTAEADSTVQVPLYIHNAAAFAGVGDSMLGGVQIDFHYNAEQLKLIGYTSTDLTERYTCDFGEYGEGIGRIIAMYTKNKETGETYITEITEEMTGDRLLGYLVFQTSEFFSSTQDVSIEIQNICDSAKSDAGKAISYNDYITAELFKIQPTKPEDENKQAAEAVDRLIDALGEITSTDQAVNVVLVRNEYEKLTEAQKDLVTKYDILVEAEETIEELKNPSKQMGDVDLSGTIDVADIMKMKALIMNDNCSQAELSIGDMDGSGALDVADILSVKNIIMHA